MIDLDRLDYWRSKAENPNTNPNGNFVDYNDYAHYMSLLRESAPALIAELREARGMVDNLTTKIAELMALNHFLFGLTNASFVEPWRQNDEKGKVGND